MNFLKKNYIGKGSKRVAFRAPFPSTVAGADGCDGSGGVAATAADAPDSAWWRRWWW